MDGFVVIWSREASFESVHYPVAKIDGRSVRDVFCDSRGNVWIGTTKGLNKYNPDNDRFIVYQSEEYTAIEVSEIFEDSKHTIWVASTKGLFYIEKNSNVLQRHPAIIECQSIAEDTQGRLWCGGDRLYLLDQDRNLLKDMRAGDINSPFSRQIRALYVDKQGLLWIGTHKGGFNVVDVLNSGFGKIKSSKETPDWLSNNTVLSLAEDNDGRIWIGTDGNGLDCFMPEENRFKNYSNNIPGLNGVSLEAVISLYYDSNNNLWLGTWANGAIKFNLNTGTFSQYLPEPNNPNSLCSRHIYAIMEDSKGNIWFGGLNGISRFAPVTETFRSYGTSRTAPHARNLSNIQQIFEDSYGEIWIASSSSVLRYLRHEDTFHSYLRLAKDSLTTSANTIHCITEDKHRNLWIGTKGGGLNRYNRETKSFSYWRRKDGLLSDVIYSIVEDDSGNLWLGTGAGISKFMQETNQFQNYGIDDGLASNEMSIGAVLKSKNGHLYFGGTEGISFFMPDSIKTNTYPPTVIITDFTVFNKSVPVKGSASYVEEEYHLEKSILELNEITIDYDQSVFGFRFTTSNYLFPQKNKYAYMLDGFDKGWQYVDNVHQASYTNLNPGTYEFRVKAANNDGFWNDRYTSVKVRIFPPFWMTRWFRILLFIGFLVSAGTFYLIRMYQMRLRQRILEEKVKERTREIENQSEEIMVMGEQIKEATQAKLRYFTNISHEFRTPLTLLLGPLELLLSDDEFSLAHKQQFKLMKRNTLRLLRLVNQLMDFRKLENNQMQLQASQYDLIPFVTEVKGVFDSMASEKKITFSLTSDRDSSMVFFDSDKLDKILFNLLSNAFKFTPENGSISIRIFHNSSKGDQGEVTIQVSDTGCGIAIEHQHKIFERFYQANQDRSVKGTGLGLSLTKRLVDLHKGKIKLESRPNEGSTFFVSLPLGKAHLADAEIAKSNMVAAENGLEAWLHEEPDGELLLQKTIDTATVIADNQSKPSLLLVEDNSELRSYVVSCLANDYKIREAENGKLALEAIEDEEPDLIISDVMMPVMDGLELTKTIKSDLQTCHIPIVLLTAKTSMDAKLKGLAEGADSYIPKPFNPSHLQIRVRKLIEMRQKLRKHYGDNLSFEGVEKAIPEQDQNFLRKITLVVEGHLTETDFSIEDLCKEIGMSRSGVYRKVKQYTGVSISEFIRTVRLKKAATLLQEGKLNLTEIAYETGFASLSYFSKCFKKQFGNSPSEFGK